ncbi:MAG: site-specific integrase [Bacteroidetes bacterium]|nr:site-specific integrase [Bacteroidota bacterium]
MAYLRKKGKNYFVVFYYRGKRYEKSCKTSHRQVAEAVRRHVEEEVASRTFKIENIEQANLKLLDEYIEEYLAYSRTSKSKKTLELDTLATRNLREYTGNVPLDSITTQQMERLKAALLTKYSPTSVNMIVRSLRAAFAKGMLWKYIGLNPMKGVDYIRLPEEEGPFLSKEDIEKLRGVMNPGLYCDFIETALYTGMRIGEIRNLSWNDIDFLKMKIRVRNTESFSTKSKKERTVPLHPRLVEILSLRSRVDHSPLVFLRSDLKQVDPGTANKEFRKYCKKAGLDPRFHFHTLRHTFASHLAINGVSLYFIQKILGHQSIETTTRTYAHLQPEPLVHAVKQLNY